MWRRLLPDFRFLSGWVHYVLLSAEARAGPGSINDCNGKIGFRLFDEQQPKMWRPLPPPPVCVCGMWLLDRTEFTS